MSRLFGDLANTADAKNIAQTAQIRADDAYDLATDALTAASPLSYSATEKDSGRTWVDGKTIYYKVVEYSGTPGTGQTLFAHGITNLDRVIQCYANTILSDGRRLTLPYSDGSNVGWQWGVSVRDTTNIAFAKGSQWASSLITVSSNIQVVLFYTKT